MLLPIRYISEKLKLKSLEHLRRVRKTQNERSEEGPNCFAAASLREFYQIHS